MIEARHSKRALGQRHRQYLVSLELEWLVYMGGVKGCRIGFRIYIYPPKHDFK